MFLTPAIEVYPVTNVRKNFVTPKFWQIFKLSHAIVMGVGVETMSTKLISRLVRNNMETCHPST